MTDVTTAVYDFFILFTFHLVHYMAQAHADKIEAWHRDKSVQTNNIKLNKYAGQAKVMEK